MINKIISNLKKERNKIYCRLEKIDKKIVKEEMKESEDIKKEYVGKYFKKKSYSNFPEYVKIVRYIKQKGFDMINVDVDNGKDIWLSRYVTYHLPFGLIRCSKKLFEEKLKKGINKLR